MSKKVVHVSEEFHSRLKTYCDARGLRMNDWVMRIVAEAMGDEVLDEPTMSAPQATTTTPKPARRVTERTPVPKKNLPKYERTADNDTQDIYSAPPFWKRS